MAIQEIQENDLIKDSREVINNNFTELDEGKLSLSGGTLTGNVYTTPYYDSTIVDPEGGQTLIVSKGKVAKGTAPSNNEWHTMVMAVDNSGSTNNANKYGQVETGVKTDGSVETVVQAYKNEANSTTSAKISVGYDANGNAFTSAPTPATTDDSTKIATTAWVRDVAALAGHTHSYLPLSGGTMTGEITRKGYVVRNSVDNSFTEYLGGKDENSAYLVLYGKSHSNTPGRINLRAIDGTNNSYLTLDPNGSATWGGHQIERVNSSGSNYIRFESGLQIVWGLMSIPSGTSGRDVSSTITFPVAFADANYIVAFGNNWRATSTEYYRLEGKNTTGTKFVAVGVSGNPHDAEYILIGRWK